MGILETIKGRLIVSCQAQAGEPLRVDGYMAKMALAAQMGGAAAIRAESPADIKAICEEVDLPVVGLWKLASEGSDVYITPTIEAARAVYESGASIVAIDATQRKNVKGDYAFELIRKIKDEMDVLVMADISTVEEGLNAERHGADVISTTLAGYTDYSRKLDGPDFQLISELAQQLKKPMVAEGKVNTPEQARRAMELGAHAVVVGGAITRPLQITRVFAQAIENI